jgi:phosphatidylglycerol---prolipoprotein diacylglyceryl transferase
MKFLAILQYPQIDPFIFRWGNVGLSWYAFSYLLAFILAYFILRYRMQKGVFRLPHSEDLWLLISYEFYGVVLGARIFYVLFYNLRYFWEHLWEIPAIWHGGMSFHGGLVGLILASILFGRRSGVPASHILDNLALCAPLGLGFGRIANFINGELYGRVSNVPWAMVFPQGGPQPRHPSQLYESFLEGPLLFLIVFLTTRRRPKDGTVAAVFVLAYGVLRFFEEFFREPDAQLGPILGPFSMGQLLCFAMIIMGLGALVWIKPWGENASRSPGS